MNFTTTKMINNEIYEITNIFERSKIKYRKFFKNDLDTITLYHFLVRMRSHNVKITR
jgi:hypothetical protein